MLMLIFCIVCIVMGLICLVGIELVDFILMVLFDRWVRKLVVICECLVLCM